MAGLKDFVTIQDWSSALSTLRSTPLWVLTPHSLHRYLATKGARRDTCRTSMSSVFDFCWFLNCAQSGILSGLSSIRLKVPIPLSQNQNISLDVERLAGPKHRPAPPL